MLDELPVIVTISGTHDNYRTVSLWLERGIKLYPNQPKNDDAEKL
jgi:hypothetical protein